MLKIIDRLVWIELRGPFFFGVAMFSMLIVATVGLQQAAKFVNKYDLPVSMFFRMLWLAMPELVMYSIPMGVLLGTLIAVGRLSGDNEITALQTCGISLHRVLVPFLVVGVFLSGLTFVVNERVVPYCNSKLTELKNEVISGSLGVAHQERLITTIRDGSRLAWLLLAERREGNELFDVRLYYFDARNKDKDFLLYAARAEWEGDNWTFYNGRQMQFRPGPEMGDQVILNFQRMLIPDFKITPESLAMRVKEPKDLTAAQLATVIQERLKKGEEQPSSKTILDFRTQLYYKYAIPLLPLFFIFVALPLAILPQRSSRSTGMGLALVTVLVYYFMYATFSKLGAAGVVPPLIAAWTPNAVLGIVGVVLMQRREHG